jgi:membrane-bound lytic murein transglycosylase D
VHRLIPALLLSAVLLVPDAAAQWTSRPTQKAATLPAERLPDKSRADAPRQLGAQQADATKPAELSEEDILRRLGRIYRLQSEILDAQASHESEKAEDLLSVALDELASLLQHPGMMERVRFRETYRSLVTEYERFYGVAPDSLGLQHGDIFQMRVEMFAEMNEIDHPLMEHAFPREFLPVQSDIPMVMNRLVEQSIAFLQRNPDRHIHNWLSRAETYFPMIEQILAEENVPDELKYLAMVESGLNPRARSWASAVGMWQFMAPTGRQYGLHVNAWVDDRMNPEKATRAGARYLRDLHAQFGDWHLALAAYNCGPGNVRRAQRRSGKTSFWEIYDHLPRETRNYVPMFIATTLVGSNPQAFGLRQVEPGPRYAYHQVPVEGMLSTSEIARLAGTTEAAVRALNPELLRDTLPPSDSPYLVRLPFGTHETFIAGYSKLESVPRRSNMEHTVRRGDSLGRIASQHGVSLSELMQANGLRSTVIHPGQRLAVPVQAVASGRAPANINTRQILAFDYGTRANRPVATGRVVSTGRFAAANTVQTQTPVARTSSPAAPASDEAEAPAPRQQPATQQPAASSNTATANRSSSSNTDTRVVYTVRRGDNLSSIAQRYNVSIAQIRSWNNLRNNNIQAGQRLTMYTNSDAPAPAPSRVTHVVRRGETLSGIASRYNVSVAQIRSWNNLRSNTIRVNQRLTINSNSTAVNHQVQRGDTLTEIARRYGVTVSQIRQLNNLRGDTIRPGQTLTIRT